MNRCKRLVCPRYGTFMRRRSEEREAWAATYQVPQGFNAALGYDVIEMIVE